MTDIFYDLTELYLGSFSKLKYYGIARVVAELAYDLKALNPKVRFVVYDETRRGLFEIQPLLGKSSANGLISLGLPRRGIPLRLRTTHENASTLKAKFNDVSRYVTTKANHFRFPDFSHYLTRIIDAEGVLISAARPKFLADLCDFLAETSPGLSVHAILHDMIPLHDYYPSPSRFQSNFRFDNARILHRAGKIVPVSNYSKLQVEWAIAEGFLKLPKSDAVVQLCHECRSDGQDPDIALPDRDYIIGVGITLGRKNLDVVLKAMEILLAAGKIPPLLVIAGTKRMRTRSSIEKGRFAALLPHVRFEISPSQANLIELYKNAMATVMPSKLEGWGLPLGESLWLGTPAIASPNSSLPEVGRDLAVYFEPDNAEKLAAILENFQNDKVCYAALKARISAAKSSLRTWRDVANDHLALANQVLAVT